MKLIIGAPETPEQFEECLLLRWRILRAPWRQPRGSETDELDETAEHVAARDATGRLVGIGRLHFPRPTEAQIRYMATDECYRGRGVGRAILIHLEAIAVDRGVRRILLNARDPAVGFYERHGYRVVSAGPTLFGEIRHTLMEKRL
jgi:ribosomal protein S18 acetylase RimI-like enzyme